MATEIIYSIKTDFTNLNRNIDSFETFIGVTRIQSPSLYDSLISASSIRQYYTNSSGKLVMVEIPLPNLIGLAINETAFIPNSFAVKKINSNETIINVMDGKTSYKTKE